MMIGVVAAAWLISWIGPISWLILVKDKLCEQIKEGGEMQMFGQ